MNFPRQRLHRKVVSRSQNFGQVKSDQLDNTTSIINIDEVELQELQPSTSDIISTNYDGPRDDSRSAPITLSHSDYGDLASNFFWHRLLEFNDRLLFIDNDYDFPWPGIRIRRAAVLVTNLLREYKLNDDAFNIMIICENRGYSQAILLGVLFAGGVACTSQPHEVTQNGLVEILRPSVIFTDDELLVGWLSNYITRSFSAILVVFMGRSMSRIIVRPPKIVDGFKQILSKVLSQPCNYELEPDEEEFNTMNFPTQVNPNHPAIIQFTGGAETGKPRPVIITQKNLLSSCLSLLNQDIWKLTKDSILVGQPELVHWSNRSCLQLCFVFGCRLILVSSYDQQSIIHAIKKYRATDLMMASNHFRSFWDLSKGFKNTMRLRSIENVVLVGSSNYALKQARKFMKRYPRCAVRQAYGTAECGLVSIVKREFCDKYVESIGDILPGFTIKLCDLTNEDEVISKNDIIGHLMISGDAVSTQYFNIESVPEISPSDSHNNISRYLKTSDIVSLLPEGQMKYIGKKNQAMHLVLDDQKEIAFPEEIEAILSDFKCILEAFVWGAPHPDIPNKQLPRAYVFSYSDRVKPKDIIKYSQSRLPEIRSLKQGGCQILKSPFYKMSLARCNRLATMKNISRWGIS